MTYYLWIVVNFVFLISSALYIWLIRTSDSMVIVAGQFFAQLAILLFLINVNMYFIFLVIRKSHQRKIKILLAKLSRKMMKAHIPLAVIGTTLILLHAGIMLVKAGIVIGWLHPKMISGYTALLFLFLTLIGGYRRHKRASGFRRKFHLVMALLFAVFFILHLFLPL